MSNNQNTIIEETKQEAEDERKNKFTIMEYPSEMMIYNQATFLSRKTKQMVGEKNDLYITLKQLMNIIKDIQELNKGIE